MKLIEDLGTQYNNPNIPGKRKYHFGLYECPVCHNSFRCAKHSVQIGATTKCRACADKSRNDTSAQIRILKAAEVFAEESSKIHNNKYDYSLVVYVNSITNIKIICPKHGIFEQRPNNHKNGIGCPSCALSGFDKNKSAILYYLKISIDDLVVAYKIGITNRTVQDRFNNTDLEKIQVLKTWDFPLGTDAFAKEQEILKLYKEFRYLGEPMLSSGNTELFTYDILGLDYEETPVYPQ